MLVGRLYTLRFKTSCATQVIPKPTCPVPEVLDFVSSMLVGVVASDTSAVPGTTKVFWGWDGWVNKRELMMDDGFGGVKCEETTHKWSSKPT